MIRRPPSLPLFPSPPLFRSAGGTETDLTRLRRNPGGEALNAYLHGLAATSNPVGLLGAIYIIEGTGQRIVPSLLPLLRARDRKSTRLNSSHVRISYAVFCLK